MPTYRVRWEIDIDADSPEEAALQAMYMQQDSDAKCHVFYVHTEVAPPPPAHWVRVDLDEDA